MGGGDGDVVEETETHGLGPLGVVARRAHAAEGVFGLAAMTRSVASMPAPAERSAACQVPALMAVSGSRWTMPLWGALSPMPRTYSAGCTRAICSSVASGAS
jgi:hypothetical protein